MVRPAKWISSLALGLALACEGLAAEATAAAPEKTPAQVPAAQTQQPADVEDEGDDDAQEPSAKGLVDRDVIPAHSINTNAANDEESGEDFGISHNRMVSDATPAEIPVSELIKERFANGSVRVERRVTQDPQGNYLNHGSWKQWDQRGAPVAQGTYDFSNRAGTWTRWYRNATDVELLASLPYSQFTAPYISQATFKHDQLDGAWTIYDGKMHKISQIHFQEGKRHGAATWWFASGRKMREMEYKEGELEGPLAEWNAEGKLIAKEIYQGGRRIATKSATHSAGVKKSEGVYLFPKDIEKTPDDWWNCKLATSTKTGNEEKHGPWTSWYANGQAQLEGAYEHDVQVGKFVWWHANGQKAQEGRFDHGKQDGVWTWWFPSGQKSIRGEYVKGNPTGKWTWWKEDGRVVQAADLSHGDGIVVELPTSPDGQPLPRSASPTLGQPIKR